MTEKRFKAYGNNFIAIDDNVENKTYYLNEDVDRIVDLLNSLSDENEQLRNDLDDYGDANATLEAETLKLRKELHIVETDCKNVKESRNHYREENEQLKNRLNAPL